MPLFKRGPADYANRPRSWARNARHSMFGHLLTPAANWLGRVRVARTWLGPKEIAAVPNARKCPGVMTLRTSQVDDGRGHHIQIRNELVCQRDFPKGCRDRLSEPLYWPKLNEQRTVVSRPCCVERFEATCNPLISCELICNASQHETEPKNEPKTATSALFYWPKGSRARRDSNSRPSDSKSDALSS